MVKWFVLLSVFTAGTANHAVQQLKKENKSMVEYKRKIHLAQHIYNDQ